MEKLKQDDGPRAQQLLARKQKVAEDNLWIANKLKKFMLDSAVVAVANDPAKAFREVIEARMRPSKGGETLDFFSNMVSCLDIQPQVWRRAGQALFPFHAVGAPPPKPGKQHMTLTSGHTNSVNLYGNSAVVMACARNLLETLQTSEDDGLEELVAAMDPVQRGAYEVVRRHRQGEKAVQSSSCCNRSQMRVPLPTLRSWTCSCGAVGWQAAPGATIKRLLLVVLGYLEGVTSGYKSTREKGANMSVSTKRGQIPVFMAAVQAEFRLNALKSPVLKHLVQDDDEKTMAHFEAATLRLGSAHGATELRRVMEITLTGLKLLVAAYLTVTAKEKGLLQRQGLPPGSPRKGIDRIVAAVRFLFHFCSICHLGIAAADDHSAVAETVALPVPAPSLFGF